MIYRDELGAAELAPNPKLFDLEDVLVALEQTDPNNSQYDDLALIRDLARYGSLVYEKGPSRVHIYARQIASILREVRAFGGPKYAQADLEAAERGFRVSASEEMATAATQLASLSVKFGGSLYLARAKDEKTEVVQSFYLLDDELNVGVITGETEYPLGNARLRIDASSLSSETEHAIEKYASLEE